MLCCTLYFDKAPCLDISQAVSQDTSNEHGENNLETKSNRETITGMNSGWVPEVTEEDLVYNLYWMGSSIAGPQTKRIMVTLFSPVPSAEH